METYGGRLSSSTRSRSVKNTHQTAASMLVKEGKYLDKLMSSSQRSIGREEEKLKKRLEAIELERSKSPSRSFLDKDEEETLRRSASGRDRTLPLRDGVDPASRSGSHIPAGKKRRESIAGTGTPGPALGPRTGRQRAMSLAVGKQEELLAKKSVTFDPKSSDFVPCIIVTDDDKGSRDGLDRASSHKAGTRDHKHALGTDGSIHNLYDMAIQTVASSNDMEFEPTTTIPEKQKQKQKAHSSYDMHSRRPSFGSNSHISAAPLSKATLDLRALKELEEILKDSRLYTTKKCRQMDAGSESSTMRQQKKRMVQLEQLLSSLKIGQKKEVPPVKLDPLEVLNCSYLRLSKSNVESLERMVRESGRDPGIHAHSDVTDFELFEKPQDSVQER